MVSALLIEKDLIKKAKDKLKDNMFDIMMSELGIEDYDARNKKCRCPFHQEDTASFIYNPKQNDAHCFGACGRSFDIIDVLMSKGLTYIEAVKRLFELADITYAFGEHHVKTEREYKYPKDVCVDNPKKVYDYLALRNISPKTADYLHIGQDDQGNLVFNYYDLNDTLTMVKYRPSHKIDKSKKEQKNWCQAGADTTPLLYNMNRINTSQTLAIFCGELDCAAAVEAGYLNSVSIPFGDGNLHWIEKNFEWLEQFDDIIICPDNDDSGKKFRSEVIPRLGSWRCKVVDLPVEYEGKYIKDANEFLVRAGAQALLTKIVNAESVPVPSLKTFESIHETDISEIDGIKTGFEKMDKELHRLFFGSFNIVSGYPSSGKTSFLYSLICNAADQGHNCFIYSRELPDWMSKNWLTHMFAGRRNHIEKSSGDDTFYCVPPDAKRAIDNEYGDRIVLYRDDFPNDSKSILESMVSATRKHGTRMFLLDNLMTIDLGGSDENRNERQTEFINELIAFTTKYQVVVILVCHPNKQADTTQNVGMYQISGTSNIINLAHRAFGLRRITKREKEGYSEGRVNKPPVKHDVVISVIKDRFGGRTSEYEMYYDEVDRRFYSTQAEYDRQYSWDKNEYTTPLISYRLIDEAESEVYGE